LSALNVARFDRFSARTGEDAAQLPNDADRRRRRSGRRLLFSSTASAHACAMMESVMLKNIWDFFAADVIWG
jgi:hypothetical protein